MSTSLLSSVSQPLRAAEWLMSPDARLSSTALSTGQLGSLGPITSLEANGLDLSSTEGAVSGLTGSITQIANQTVLDLHAALENAGHEIPPLNGPLHALTNLGETVGLGRVGEPGHLLTDALAIPSAVADGGGLASAAPVLNDVGPVLGASDGLVTSVLGSAIAHDPLASGGLLGPVSNLANAVATDVQANLQGLGSAAPFLHDTIQGAGALGETLGSGHLGTSGTLVTDIVALPGSLLGGQGSDGVQPVLSDLGTVAGAATGLLEDIVQIPGNLLGGPTDAGGGLLAPVTSLLGGPNGGAPGGLLGGLAGDGLLAPVTSLLDDLTGGHSGQPLSGLLGSVTGGAGASANDLLGDGGLLQPVADSANGVIDAVHAGLETLGHDVPLLNDPIHEVIELGTTVGLGALGEGNNLLTDVVNLPGDLLSGEGAGAIDHVATDLGNVVGATGDVLGTVPGVLDDILGGLTDKGAGSSGGLLGGDGPLAPVAAVLGGVTGGDAASANDLLGSNGLLQPVADSANGVIDAVHAGLETLGHDVPLLNEPLHEVIELGTTVGLGALGEGDNLLTDVVNLPGDLLDGEGARGIDHVATDLGNVVGAAGDGLGTVPGVLDDVVGGLADKGAGSPDGILSPVTSTLESVVGSGDGPLGSGLLSPVTSLLDSVTGDGDGSSGGGILGPVTSPAGDPTAGGSEGTHPLIDIAVGPATATPVANVGVLSPPAVSPHTIEVGAIGVGSDQPSLISASLLSGDSLPLPSTDGSGADSLVGQALDLIHTAPSGSAHGDAPHGAGLDLGLVSIDIGGHVDVHHSDPTPHSSTGGLHLLGL